MVQTIKTIFKYNVGLVILLVGLLAMGLSIDAQGSVALSSLRIQIWPEFDRPETLVIYQGEVDSATPLPATLTFNLPADVASMHAVAVATSDGNLVNNPYQLNPNGDKVELVLSIDSPRFQFEYYDPGMIVKNGTERQLNFNISTNYPVAQWQMEFQEPLGATNVKLSPEADEVTTGTDNFVYHIYRRENVEPGPVMVLNGKYTKESDTLTTQVQVDIPQSLETSTAPMSSQNWTLTIGYLLVGLGVGVLLVGGGIWIFNNSSLGHANEPPRRPARKRGALRESKSKSTRSERQLSPRQPPAVQMEAKFCPQCGTPYNPDAKFCHQCGAPRR